MEDMESYAKEVLVQKYGIDVRHMAPDAIGAVRSVMPKIAALIEIDRDIVDLLLQLAQQGDTILQKVADGE